MTDVERELARLMRRYNAHATAINQLTPERDALIVAAMQARIPRSRIIELTGLSRQRLDQIRQALRTSA